MHNVTLMTRKWIILSNYLRQLTNNRYIWNWHRCGEIVSNPSSMHSGVFSRTAIVMQCGSVSSSWCTAGRCRPDGPYELNGCDGDRLTYGWRPMVDTVLSSTSSSSSDRPSMTSFSFGLWRDLRSRPLTRISIVYISARPFHCRRSAPTNSPDRNLGDKCFERSFYYNICSKFLCYLLPF